jgi:6-phosphogluconolactonase
MSTAPVSTAAHVVLVQSNELDQNRMLAFRRGDDGRLTSLGDAGTGGAGSGAAHLPSQGSIVLTGDGGHAMLTNAGSGDVSVFAVEADGPVLLQTVPTGGTPRSVAEHAGLVYVLNTADPSVAGFRMDGGKLVPIDGSIRQLQPSADPAQVGFSPDGRTLIVTERGTDTIVAFPVLESGILAEPTATPSSGPTPYGFAVTRAGVLVVTEAFGAQTGKAAASSYTLEDGRLSPASRSVGNGRSEICWTVVTPDGRYAFTTNFADGAVSGWAVGADGTLELRAAAAGVTEDGRKGLRDAGLSADGRFLYALDADAGQIYGWSVDGDGSLTPIGSWADLPATAAGLAVR